MEFFENITLEQVIVTLVLGIIGTFLATNLERLAILLRRGGLLFWFWVPRFIRTTRQQRRLANYVEVRRRTKNENYLSYKEGVVHIMMLVLLILCFLLLLMVLLAVTERPGDPVIIIGVILISLLGGVVTTVLALAEASRNFAARALRAGLTRDPRTKQYRWPPRSRPSLPQPLPSGGSQSAKPGRREAD